MWTLIKSGGVGENYGYAHKEFMLDSESDLNSEPVERNIAPGSIAFLSDKSKTWNKNAQGVWILMAGSGSGGSINADWNASSGEEGYIENRPGMYDGQTQAVFVTVLKSATGTHPIVNDFSKNWGDINFNNFFVEGSSVQLIIGDTVFPKTTIRKAGGTGSPMFGNEVVRLGTDTGESYAVYYNSPGTISSIYVQAVDGKDTSWNVPGEIVKILVDGVGTTIIPDKYVFPDVPLGNGPFVLKARRCGDVIVKEWVLDQ